MRLLSETHQKHFCSLLTAISAFSLLSDHDRFGFHCDTCTHISPLVCSMTHIFMKTYSKVTVCREQTHFHLKMIIIVLKHDVRDMNLKCFLTLTLLLNIVCTYITIPRNFHCRDHLCVTIMYNKHYLNTEQCTSTDHHNYWVIWLI